VAATENHESVGKTVILVTLVVQPMEHSRAGIKAEGSERPPSFISSHAELPEERID
jgi:hypothetical protein